MITLDAIQEMLDKAKYNQEQLKLLFEETGDKRAGKVVQSTEDLITVLHFAYAALIVVENTSQCPNCKPCSECAAALIHLIKDS